MHRNKCKPTPDRTSQVALLLLLILILRPVQALAVPSFSQQTGQPCAACHVGAFGPQLKQYGRDFKLNGYTASDGKLHGLPIATAGYVSFTHTDAAQPVPPATHFAVNDNFAIDELSLYYGGRITSSLGALAQVTYDGVARQGQIDDTDIRYAHDTDFLGQDTVYGFTANNDPTVSDLWNSTPAWGFPYNGSRLAPTPLAASLIDGGLEQRVAGGGGYAMWKDLVYAEADLYRGLGYDVLNATGIVPVAGTGKTRGLIPYWRLALQQDFGRHYVEIGTYGITASVLPGGIDVGPSNRYTDVAIDTTYQFNLNPMKVISDIVSAHATWIHEDASLGASESLTNALKAHQLDTARADVSYSFCATITPTLQYFRTSATNDIAYWATPGGRPDSSGFIGELAYVPWGKPNSFISWGNVRFAVQYVGYSRFDGDTHDASANNTLYFSFWAAAHF